MNSVIYDTIVIKYTDSQYYITTKDSANTSYKKAFQKTWSELIKDDKIISFEPLQTGTLLNYNECVNVAKNLNTMLNNLILEGLTIYSLSLRDIYKINNSKYIFVNSKKCITVTPADKIHCNAGLENKGDFIAPELCDNKSPIVMVRPTANWCIGELLLTLLFNDKTKKDKLDTIKYTSLYYFIKRCLNKNVILREVIYI